MPAKVSENSTPSVSTNGTAAPENYEAAANGLAHLAEIRKIIVAPETVAEVLPAAVKNSLEHGKQLSEATLPLTESNIRESIKRDPRILAEAIFPIIAPAIAKAIAAALDKMVQSFNRTLEQSLTVNSLKWRVEAWRTGKNLGEVVMLNTLLYRVEQVFLIHKKTGILLRHVCAPDEQTADAEMVSAMLTAIQDFVQDSFRNAEGATLDALKVRDLSVWIEHRREAILAVVIRGTAPLELRETLTAAIDRVNFNYESELARFAGETAPFEPSGAILEDCLRRHKGRGDNPAPAVFSPLNIIGAIALMLVLTAGFFYVRDYLRWSNYLDRLRGADGIVVTEASRGFFKHQVGGLRRSDAARPEDFLAEYGYDVNDVESHWVIYHDLSPKIVLENAVKILKPPPTVVLSLENNILIVRGAASVEWLLQARETSRSIAGVDGFKVER